MTNWRIHRERDALLAEAHARHYTPLSGPTLATRLATLSGEAALADDRAHMTALCRQLGAAEPGPDSRWCSLDAGTWSLREAFKALEHARPGFDATLATGILAPLLVTGVWFAMRRIRDQLEAELGTRL